MAATLNAASPGASKKHSLFAATGVTRVDTSSTFGGYSNFDTANRFRYYAELARVSPHVSTSLDKLGKSIAKGMRFDGDTKSVVKDFNTWSKKTNFIGFVQTLTELLCRDGTIAARPVGIAETMRFNPLLMPNVTMLPDGVEVGNTNTKTVLEPEITKIIVNEKPAMGTVTTTYEASEVIYGAVGEWKYQQQDIYKRETNGVYGASFLEPIELSIRNLLSINQGYVSFVQKYGNGRYVFNFAMLEKLLELKLITVDQADAIVASWMDEHQYLKANEDIVGVGLQVTPIDANGSLDVLSFKKSLEADIQIGLYQTPLSMGDTKGSTYAAGYVSEEDRMIVLEGLQRVVQNIAQQAINLRLNALRKPIDSVWIEFDELSKPQLTGSEMIEAVNSGILTKETFMQYYGFNIEGQ